MNDIDDPVDMFFNFIEKQVIFGREKKSGGNRLFFASHNRKNIGGKKRQGATLHRTGNTNSHNCRLRHLCVHFYIGTERVLIPL